MIPFKDFLEENLHKALKYHWRNERKMGNPFGSKLVRWPLYGILGGSSLGAMAGMTHGLATRNYPEAIAHAAIGLPMIAGNILTMKHHIKDVLEIRKKLKQMKKSTKGKQDF